MDELVRARLATIQPYLHVVGGGWTGEPDPYLIGLEVQVDLRNLGNGPAIDAVARLDHDRLRFRTDTPPQSVAAGDRCTMTFTVEASTADPGPDRPLSQELRLV